MDREFEISQIKRAVDAIMKRFDGYVIECELNYPICWKCKQRMCLVTKKGDNDYFTCLERGCGCRKEWGI